MPNILASYAVQRGVGMIRYHEEVERPYELGLHVIVGLNLHAHRKPVGVRRTEIEVANHAGIG